MLAIALLSPTYGLALATPQDRADKAAAIPPAVAALDTAAASLFDAAERRQWSRARTELDKARSAARGAAALEGPFAKAGGELHRYFQAINNLSGDLIEAGTALSVKDARWLVNAADRIAARAGELSQPFVQRSGAIAQRVEVLIFLARRMRRALVWSDGMGYQAAREDFRRLWANMHTQVSALSPGAQKSLDDALARLSSTTNAGHARALQRAVEALRS